MNQINSKYVFPQFSQKASHLSLACTIQKHDKNILESPDWFKLYSVTQEQHDEWVNWAKEHVRKITKMSKKMINNVWWTIDLDCSPNVINDDK